MEHNQGEQLRRTVRINEEIKQVIRISSGINLTAVNAMLVAKRSGERSRGYGVVSGELRSFSGRLEALMDETGMLISGMIGDMAWLLNQRRSREQMARATRMSERAAELLGEAMEKKDRDVSKTRKKILDLGGRLDRQAGMALKLCQSGVALARSAKIEAVYGGEMAETLGQVSIEVEGRMAELFERLKFLNAEVQAWQM
ncbi:MAG: hypothetical protein ACYCZR_10285 [Burkholderiales bacterium]